MLADRSLTSLSHFSRDAVDFVLIRSVAAVRMFGPAFGLCVMSSRGWPFVVTTWGILDFFFLSRLNVRFSSQWPFCQDAVGLFNASNPSGNVTESKLNVPTLLTAVVLGVIVAIKRFLLGLFLGRRTHSACTFPQESTWHADCPLAIAFCLCGGRSTLSAVDDADE